MSVDTVNYALTKVRRQLERYPEFFTPEGLRSMVAMCECMRDSLMKEDIAGFDSYVDGILARHPDSADYILEALFDELDFPLGAGTREHLSAELIA